MGTSDADLSLIDVERVPASSAGTRSPDPKLLAGKSMATGVGAGGGPGIESFRQISGGFQARELKLADDGGMRQSSVSRLTARVQGWFSSPTQDQVAAKSEARVAVKENFLGLLAKTEGQVGAGRALEACGLPADFAKNDRPLTNHTVKQILNAAQQYRMDTVKANEAALAKGMEDLQGVNNRDLRAAVSREVKNHPNFGSTSFSAQDIQELRQSAEKKYGDARAELCKDRFPGITALVENKSLDGVTRDASRMVSDLRKATEGDLGVKAACGQLDNVTMLLGRQAWNHEALSTLSQELKYCREDLGNAITRLSDEVAQLAPAGGQGRVSKEVQAKVDVRQALMEDMHRQIDLVDAKSAYIDEMQLTNPLTDRSIKHSNLLWAQAGHAILDHLQSDVNAGRLTLSDQQTEDLKLVRTQWDGLTLNLKAAYDDSSNITAIEAPVKDSKESHPLVLQKRGVQSALYNLLEGAELPKATIDALFSKESLGRAERTALSKIETWQPIDREMPVMRDGTLRVYHSKITPAQFIHPSLGTGGADGRSEGVAAGVKDSTEHARNLKVSQLTGPDGKVMSTVVGHGVLDMWDVKDGAERDRANANGAKEVLEVALSTNDRLRESALNQDPTAKPPRLVHCSVNLISPDSMRELLPLASVHDYKERTYTVNQFKAFEANTGPGQTLRVFGADPNQQVQEAKVDVDTITFSFGINAISTSVKQHLMNVWSNVHDHNTRNMVKLVGDLGSGEFGARGTRPGGFVGEAYDRIEAIQSDPLIGDEAKDLMAQLRGQTDLVRGMFTEETFRQGNGDTAKMGREILVLQGLAEQALDLAKAPDLAGTSSKGCKSDKDRGGVTDVELKSKLILRDLGGEMNPDERLQGDDQGVYYTVSASSGQLENQRWNTGVGGSKEAGHLKDRLPNPNVRQFLSGMGVLAKA